MVLRDGAGNVVDGLNYGGLVDPWAAEGYQATSGAGENGNFAPAPVAGRGFRMGPSQPAIQPNKSAFRYPDGADSDNNGRDFVQQNSTSLSVAAEAGSKNIKVASVSDLFIGQKVIVGSGLNSEIAVLATIGTPGGTTLGNATEAGKKSIPVASVEGFNTGQTITIDNSTNRETAVIAGMIPARRRFGSPGNNVSDSITIAVPLKFAHIAGTQVSGSGITLAASLTKAHDKGTPVAANLPTPGEPNQFFRKP